MPLGKQKYLLMCHLVGGSLGPAVSSCVFSEDMLKRCPGVAGSIYSKLKIVL